MGAFEVPFMGAFEVPTSSMENEAMLVAMEWVVAHNVIHDVTVTDSEFAS